MVVDPDAGGQVDAEEEPNPFPTIQMMGTGATSRDLLLVGIPDLRCYNHLKSCLE